LDGCTAAEDDHLEEFIEVFLSDVPANKEYLAKDY
jgi:hypothetical protein